MQTHKMPNMAFERDTPKAARPSTFVSDLNGEKAFAEIGKQAATVGVKLSSRSI